ncbi:transposase [Methylocystis sp. JAN1]|uniref:transposase n=1 Tax=Methylocystis sp. JAN1 TaxID=3397211 RepID=UPI003FA2AE44
MLTAILLAYDAPARPLRRDAVTRSLASLVDACVQGLVADAVLVGAPGSGLSRIADEAGCTLVEASDREEGLAQALDVARQDAAFLLLAGHAIERGFIDEMDDAFAYAEAARAFVLRSAPTSLVTRLAPSFAEPVGLIARKSALRAAGSGDFRKLAKRLRCAELKSSARRTF